MLKRSVLSVILALVVIAGLLFACAPSKTPTPPPPAPTPAATTPTAKPPAPTTPAATTPAPTPIKLKVGFYLAEDHPFSVPMKYLMKVVPERTKGGLTFDMHWRGSLATLQDSFDAVSTGAIDMSKLSATYVVGKIPLINALSVPGYARLDTWANTVKDMRPLLEEEYAKNNIKYLADDNPYLINYCTRKKPLKQVADFKGLLIRGPGGYSDRLISVLGASPVQLPTGDVYEALQRGTVDGTHVGASTYVQSKYYEVAPYLMDILFASGAGNLVVNMNVWNKMPKEWQKIMMDAVDESLAPGIDALKKDISDLDIQYKKFNVNVYRPTPQELAEFQTAFVKIWDVAEKDLGPKGKQLLDIFRKYTK